MSDDIDLALNLDPSGYVQGANQAAAASDQLAQAYSRVERSGTLLQRAMDAVTPRRLGVAGFVAATKAAGDWEQALSYVQARATVTGQSVGRLTAGMQSLARQMPVGNRGALEVSSTIQSLGLSARNQVGTINALGRSFVNLGAATNSAAPMIGRQMVTLDRAFGASDDNVKRFDRMGDSLTTVQAKIGGSASEILAFSKNIAPMARQAGIGQTAVMGISAAFSKMGEDGYLASNAMNKVLSDLNRSVRDGSGELGTYANIVGKTREEFEALFKLSPTRAVQEVLTSLAGPGGQGQRAAERIGLEGVRTQRVLQGLAQQGGIQSAVDTAVSAYGNGSTDRAARAAMNGLNDEFTKLRSAVGQVTDAFGRPLLGAVTNIVRVAGVPVKAAATVLNTGMVQTALKVAIPAALGYGAFRALGVAGNMVATGRQMFFNNTLTQGFQQGRQTGLGHELTGVTGVRDLVQAGTATPFQHRVFDVGRGFGRAQLAVREQQVQDMTRLLVSHGMEPQTAFEQASVPGRSVAARARGALLATPRALANAGRAGYSAYAAITQDSSRLLREPDATRRVSRVGMGQGQEFEGLGTLARQLKSVNASALPLNERLGIMAATVGKSAKDFATGGSVIKSATATAGKSLESTAVGLRALGSAAAATARSMAGSTKTMAVSGAVAGGSGLARAGGAVAGAAGALMSSPWTAVGLAVGTSMYANWKSGKEETKAFVDEHRAGSITGVLDEYRESTGRASDAVQTFAEQINSANKALAAQQATSFGAAVELTPAEEALARSTKDKVVHKYKGTPEQVAEQVKAASPTGLSTEDFQSIQLDLRRQFGANDVRDISHRLSGWSAESMGGMPGAVDFAKIIAPVKRSDGTSMFADVRRGFTGRGGEVDLTKSAKETVDLMGQAISQTYERNAERYGTDYAAQEQGKQVNQAFAAAQATGNADLVAGVAKALGGDLTGGKVGVSEFNNDYAALVHGKNGVPGTGGTLTDYLMKTDKDFAGRVRETGMNFGGQGGISPTEQVSALTTATTGIETFGKALSNRAIDVDSSLNKVVKAFLDLPGDTGKMRDAMDALAGDVADTGGSLSDLTGRALQTVKAMGSASSEVSKLAMAVAERAMAENAGTQVFRGTVATSRTNMAFGRQLMTSADSSVEGQQRYERGEAVVRDERAALGARLVQRLAQERAFQIQSSRAWADYHRMVGRAEEDYQRGIARAEEDFYVQRGRVQRDFGISLVQADEDFHVSVYRATRDFAKNLRRANEDAAKAMYDPYKRLQVQAVYDFDTLMTNLLEQNEAMARQVENLDRLRAAGVSNAAIDALGLGKAENAQQAARLAAEAASDPAVAAAINAAIAARITLGSTLNSDKSNKEIARAKEDFKISLHDQEMDFARSVRRQKAAFARGMADSRADFNRGMARQAEDFRRSLARQNADFNLSQERAREDIEESSKEIFGSLEKLSGAVFDLLHGKAVDWKNLMHDTLTDVVADAKSASAAVSGTGPTVMDGSSSLAEGTRGGLSTGATSVAGGGKITGNASLDAGQTVFVTAGTGSVYTGGVTGSGGSTNYRPSGTFMKAHPANASFNKAIAKSLVPGWSSGDQWNAWEFLWNAESGWNQYADNPSSSAYGIPQALPGDKMRDAGADWRTNPATQIKWGANYIKGRYGSPLRAYEIWKARSPHWYAKGGIATVPHVGVVAEAGHPEAMIPLNNQGVAKLAEAMTMFLDGPQMARLAVAGHGEKVVYTGNVFHEDHSTRFEGDVTVVAQDPDEMARKLAARGRRNRLTGAPQTKGSR